MRLTASALYFVFFVLAAVPASAEEHIHCNLAALSKADRLRGVQLVSILREVIRERKELPDGYAYRFETGSLKDVGEWVQLIAKCCQPLTYEISLSPTPGSTLWVRITGHEGAKEFIEIEFAQLTEKLAPPPGAR